LITRRTARRAEAPPCAGRVGRLEADVLRRELVPRVVLGEVGVARHDDAEHEQQRGEAQATHAEHDVERSAFHF
jgi:hypothetical protein